MPDTDKKEKIFCISRNMRKLSVINLRKLSENTYFKTRFYKALQDRDNKLKYNKYKN